MKLDAKKFLSKAESSMTHMRGDHVTVREILEERILQPTVGDDTLSAATQHDAAQRAAAGPTLCWCPRRDFKLKYLKI